LTIELLDGLLLTCQCYGHPGGRPLYFFGGLPGCRIRGAPLHREALSWLAPTSTIQLLLLDYAHESTPLMFYSVPA
jgi:hypothetical protein